MTTEHRQVIDAFIAREFVPHMEKPSNADADTAFFQGVRERHVAQDYFPDMMRAMVNMAFKQGKRHAADAVDAIFPE